MHLTRATLAIALVAATATALPVTDKPQPQQEEWTSGPRNPGPGTKQEFSGHDSPNQGNTLSQGKPNGPPSSFDKAPRSHQSLAQGKPNGMGPGSSFYNGKPEGPGSSFYNGKPPGGPGSSLFSGNPDGPMPGGVVERSGHYNMGQDNQRGPSGLVSRGVLIGGQGFFPGGVVAFGRKDGYDSPMNAGRKNGYDGPMNNAGRKDGYDGPNPNSMVVRQTLPHTGTVEPVTVDPSRTSSDGPLSVNVDSAMNTWLPVNPVHGGDSPVPVNANPAVGVPPNGSENQLLPVPGFTPPNMMAGQNQPPNMVTRSFGNGNGNPGFTAGGEFQDGGNGNPGFTGEFQKNGPGFTGEWTQTQPQPGMTGQFESGPAGEGQGQVVARGPGSTFGPGGMEQWTKERPEGTTGDVVKGGMPVPVERMRGG